MKVHEHQSWDVPGTELELKDGLLFWECTCGLVGKVPFERDEHGEVKGAWLRECIETGRIKINDHRKEVQS